MGKRIYNEGGLQSAIDKERRLERSPDIKKPHPTMSKYQDDNAQVQDVRVRLETSEYRVVAPNARTADGRVYVNGVLVIEKAGKNATGGQNWLEVGTLKMQGHGRSEPPSPLDVAIFNLLANNGDGR